MKLSLTSLCAADEKLAKLKAAVSEATKAEKAADKDLAAAQRAYDKAVAASIKASNALEVYQTKAGTAAVMPVKGKKYKLQRRSMGTDGAPITWDSYGTYVIKDISENGMVSAQLDGKRAGTRFNLNEIGKSIKLTPVR